MSITNVIIGTYRSSVFCLDKLVLKYYSRSMLPTKKAQIGYYDYTIKLFDDATSENHGDTCLEKRRINLFYNGNVQVLKETLQHELLHALCEDIFTTIKDMDSERVQEEQFIRLFSPRLMMFVRDNPELSDFIWGAEDDEE